MTEEFDFIKGFADVSLLQVEAIGKVIGRVVAAIYQTLIDAGISSPVAMNVIQIAMRELLVAIQNVAVPSSDSDSA